LRIQSSQEMSLSSPSTAVEFCKQSAQALKVEPVEVEKKSASLQTISDAFVDGSPLAWQTEAQAELDTTRSPLVRRADRSAERSTLWACVRDRMM
jgi:hypothetical protein